MSYLLGGVSVVGVAGAIVLGVLMYRLARGGRSDLHKLMQESKDLADARRDNDGYKRRVKDLEHALSERTDELSRERGALAVARKALGRARTKLAASGDATNVASDINSSLERLSKMSNVPGTATTADDHD